MRLQNAYSYCGLARYDSKTLTVTVVWRDTTPKRLQLLWFGAIRSKTLTITVVCAIRIKNCLQLQWFCAARLQNAYNYCDLARYDSQIVYNYCGFARHVSKTVTIPCVFEWHHSFPCYFIDFTKINLKRLIFQWFS